MSVIESREGDGNNYWDNYDNGRERQRIVTTFEVRRVFLTVSLPNRANETDRQSNVQSIEGEKDIALILVHACITQIMCVSYIW